MKISFDLDDTLFTIGPVDASITPRYTSSGRVEAFREGSRQLFQTLHNSGWEIVIYTASTRSTRELMEWFDTNQLPITQVISLMNEVRDFLIPIKHPPTYQIDLHIDDCPNIAMDGKKHGFEVLTIAPDDPAWTDKVLDAAHLIQMKLSSYSSPATPPSHSNPCPKTPSPSLPFSPVPSQSSVHTD